MLINSSNQANEVNRYTSGSQTGGKLPPGGNMGFLEG